LKEITSKENKIYKHALKLKTRKGREGSSEYLIEGPNLLKEALREGAEVREIFISSDKLESLEGELGNIEELGDRVLTLSPSLFLSLTDTVNPQGVIAIVGMSNLLSLENAFGEDVLNESSNIIILDRLQDPGNIGTIIRTADAAGFDLVVLVKGTGDPYQPKVVRSATGSLFRMKFTKVSDYDELIDLVHKAGLKFFATAMDAERAYYECDLTKGCAIAIGNEGNGISEELLDKADIKIRIPMEGRTESLNASVAAGILMYERIRNE